MKKTPRLILSSIFITVVLLGVVALSPWIRARIDRGNTTATPEISVPSTSLPAAEEPVTLFEFTADAQDVNALQATQRRTEVGVKEYSFGVMVESIQGQAADSQHYWALYHNGQYASAGSSETKLKAGDTVTWKYESMQQGVAKQ